MKISAARAAFFALMVPAAAAAQTPAAGAKAASLGGSFVASGTDATALWGNPALLSECRLGCLDIFGGGAASDQNEFARRVRDDFSGLDFADLSDPSHSARISRIAADLRSFTTPGTGVTGSGAAGIAYAIRGFGVGVGVTAYSGVFPTIDLAHLDPATIPFNTSAVKFRGIEARELRVGYSGTLFSGMTIGLDVRYVQGRTYTLDEPIAGAAKNPGSLALDALKKNEVRSNHVTFDAGAVFEPAPKIRVGIVGLALNEPEFRAHDGSAIPLPRTVRIGAAFAVTSFDGVVVTADADLNKAKTLVPGLSSRRIGGGVQIAFFRVGAFRDLEAVDPRWAYTGGVNLALPFIHVSLAGVYSPNQRDIGATAEFRIRL
jgi:hypothetical protein